MEQLSPEEHQRRIDYHLDMLKLLGVVVVKAENIQVEHRWKEG